MDKATLKDLICLYCVHCTVPETTCFLCDTRGQVLIIGSLVNIGNIVNMTIKTPRIWFHTPKHNFTLTRESMPLLQEQHNYFMELSLCHKSLLVLSSFFFENLASTIKCSVMGLAVGNVLTRSFKSTP